MQTAEPLVPEPRSLEEKIAIQELKGYKSPGIDEIPAELIQAGSNTVRSEIHKLIPGIRKNCHSNGRNLLGL
jgi:hypothetical protein